MVSNLPVTAIIWPKMSFWQCKDYSSFLGLLITRWLLSLYFKKVQLKTLPSSVKIKQVARIWSLYFQSGRIPPWGVSSQRMAKVTSKFGQTSIKACYQIFSIYLFPLCQIWTTLLLWNVVVIILQHILH